MLVSANLRPHASLGRVLDDLGATLFELVLGDPDRAGDIGGVAIYDPLEEPVLPQHALVLGVGLREPAQIAGRAGDEILGSIWAAVHEPLSTGRTSALRDASKLVALHLLRVLRTDRAGARRIARLADVRV